jgi:shikimate dehydrogenase
MSEKALQILRQQIDTVDRALLKLLNERANVSVQIGKLKAEKSLEVYDGAREARVLGHVAEDNPGPLTPAQVTTIFHEILRVSRELQAGDGTSEHREHAANRTPPALSEITSVYGILGNPVAYSMSPVMHNAAFAQAGIRAVYLPFEVEDLEGAVAGMRALGIKGASVTHPFKTRILKLLDEVDETAGRIGAVNTLVFRPDAIRGTNTDWVGAVKCIETLFPIEGRRFVVLGAGGAARAVVFGILKQGGQVTVVNRSRARGEALADEFSCQFVPFSEIESIRGDGLVNTTPVGMGPSVEEMPIPKGVLKHFTGVADAIYNPFKTRLLREAEAAGCAVASGFEMFLYQGTAQFKIWTGKEPPVELMRDVVLERLQAQ